jgi:hypothetical protein
MQTRKPFTVVGITSGVECNRINRHVEAFTAEEAVAEALGQLNDNLSERLSEEACLRAAKVAFIAAAVFEGHHGNAEGWPTSGWGDDRNGRTKNERRCAHFHPYTVVSVDPVTRQATVHHLTHAAAGNAERNPKMDFMLVADTLNGHLPVAYVYSEKPSAQAKSTRDERIRAMSKYYSKYLLFLGTNLPIETPLGK